MARSLDLFRQTPGVAVTLYAQGARHHQGILRRRRIELSPVSRVRQCLAGGKLSGGLY